VTSTEAEAPIIDKVDFGVTKYTLVVPSCTLIWKPSVAVVAVGDVLIKTSPFLACTSIKTVFDCKIKETADPILELTVVFTTASGCGTKL
jgi:hypothetical protein